MQASPLITVIIPVYNAEKYLRRGLDSLLAQTCGDWEAVCIDDGSTDGSAAVLEEYAARDARFRVLRQENSGVSAARNRGIREARGEWVTFLDADDWFSPELIEKLLSCPCSGQVDIIGFSAIVEYEEGVARDAQLDSAFTLKSAGEFPSTPENVGKMLGTCWGKAYRRDFLLQRELEFPLGMRQEDEVFYRCAMGVARHVYLLEYVGYHYLQAAGSYMHQHTDFSESYLLYLKGMRMVHSFYKRHGKSADWMLTVLFFLYGMLERCQGVTSRRRMRELRRQTNPFIGEAGFAELFPGDYRVRYLSLLPWWLEPFSHRSWNMERYKVCGITFAKDYYREFALVRRTTPWTIIKKIFKPGNGNDTV